MAPTDQPQKYLALAGDLICLCAVTLIGFASHGTLGTAGFRMFSTFLPLIASWLLLSPFFALYELPVLSDAKQLWRPALAMLFVAPLAAWLRGLLIGSPVLPVFVFVLGGVSALFLLTWRGLYNLYLYRKRRANG